MSLRLGETAPDFTAMTTEGEIHFHDYISGHWAILFSHPANYTPVCTTELGMAAKLKSEFDKRNTKMIGLSVDPITDFAGWLKDIKETQGADVNFPLIADGDKKVAVMYDMIHPEAAEKVTVRSVFIIGPDKKIKLTLTYPPSTGRNFVEILRVLDSLQLTANYSVSTPVNWEDGQDVIISPAIAKEDLDKKFPKGYTEVRPYLRTTPQPNR
ncbi:MAG: peroxiredoxin [Bacteroidia bacterium]|nr:peroxiredoxin [Bacteroidia bacterium]